MHHFGDPCIHCGTPHDEAAPGPCTGDSSKAVPLAYASLGVRWDNIERFRVRMSTGEVLDLCYHISENAPYYKFGRSHELTSPPRYDQGLKCNKGPMT